MTFFKRNKSKQETSVHRERDKVLGIVELIAIALGGMIGGGIFTVLGVSAGLIGAYTPFAIGLGGLLASLAAYSYVKLGVYFKEEGATYSFMKLVYPQKPFAASVIGWWVVFGYIATVALYAVTFSSYALSAINVYDETIRKIVAGLIIGIFAAINLWSVKGMGKVEDLLVFTKLAILVIIAFTLINNGNYSFPVLLEDSGSAGHLIFPIFIVASLTFVAYEGFQLVIHATNEMQDPDRNIPRAIYSAVLLASLIYIVIAYGAVKAISMDHIIEKKEYALASGASGVLGKWGTDLVVLGALLATSSAISGTLFGASRLMSVIAADGYLPQFIATRTNGVPANAILLMSLLSFSLILTGNLELILEFGSITFLLVCLLIAIANFKMRKLTNSSTLLCLIAIMFLALSTGLIVFYQTEHHIEQLYFVLFTYCVLTAAAFIYSKRETFKKGSAES